MICSISIFKFWWLLSLCIAFDIPDKMSSSFGVTLCLQQAIFSFFFSASGLFMLKESYTEVTIPKS